MQSALIIGGASQDGKYLTNLLLAKGFVVHSTVRNYKSINDLSSYIKNPKLFIYNLDINNTENLIDLIETIKPDQIYNLAAISSVAFSFLNAKLTQETNYLSVKRLVEKIYKIRGYEPKFYQASSSEMFGANLNPPQNELTEFNPISPYGESKMLAHIFCEEFRKDTNAFVTQGILFNHESPLRSTSFVTRKITDGLAQIKFGLSHNIILGNLDIKRDWGYAGDYVEAMYKIMEYHTPDAFVVATGESNSVWDFLNAAAEVAGINKNVKDFVIQDKQYYRTNEIFNLIGDSKKIYSTLGWEPKLKFYDLVKKMMINDLNLYSKLTGS